MPPAVYQAIINTVDDSHAHDVITSNALEALGSIFPDSGWGGEKKGGYEYAWTGIIGMVSSARLLCSDWVNSVGIALCRHTGADPRHLMRCRLSGMCQERRGSMSQRGTMAMVSRFLPCYSNGTCGLSPALCPALLV